MNKIDRKPLMKVERAKKHIAELEADTTNLPPHLYTVENLPHRSLAVLVYPDCYLFRYTPKESIKDHFGAIIGDTVNNLREALDYLCNNAVEIIGERKRLNFPFAADRGGLLRSQNFLRLTRVFPELSAFIADEMRPTREENIDLWAITSLCNDNKHNDFIPMTSMVNVGAEKIVFGDSSSLENIGIGGDASKTINFIRSSSPIEVHGALIVECELTFPNGAIFEGEMVIAKLKQLVGVTESAIATISKFMDDGAYSKRPN